MRFEILSKDGTKIINLNRRKALRERCLNCSGWSSGGVSSCTFDDCDLNAFRDGKGKQDSKMRAKAIRNYCTWCMAGDKYEVKRCVAYHCPLFPYRNIKVDRSRSCDSITEMTHIEVPFEPQGYHPIPLHA